MSPVLLVGGAPGAGKSTLARAVAASLDWDRVPGDDVFRALQGMTDPSTHPALHVAQDHLRYFTEATPDSLIADARALHEVCWPGFERVVRHRARFGPPAVIDSWTFTPELVASAGLPHVTSAWLVVDPVVLEEREGDGSGFTDGSSDPGRMLSNFLARSQWCNRRVEEEARSHGLSILRQDGSRSVESLVSETLGLLA